MRCHKPLEHRELITFNRQAAFKIDIGQGEFFKGQLPKFRGYAPGNICLIQSKGLELGPVANLGGDSAINQVVTKIDNLQGNGYMFEDGDDSNKDGFKWW
jgi:hypothetical protein